MNGGIKLIEIEQGKVYRLQGSEKGLFTAEHRHEDKNDEDLNHWLMRRITNPGGWEGWQDPLIYDRYRDLYVVREAIEEDYTEYLERYDEEMGNLFEQVSDLQYTINKLDDLRDEIESV